MPTTVTARTAYRHSINGLRENLRPSVAACAPSLLILLPIAAAAIGMMAFGIEFQIVEHVLM